MLIVERRLKNEGYNCINITYPSTKHSIENLSDIVHNRLKNDKKYTNADKVHFVGHSMGGLVTRHIIANSRPDNLGSVVMMGTPNKGSEMADLAFKNKYLAKAFRFIFGPAADQLRTNYEHFDNEVIDYPLGVIASDISLGPIANRVFRAPNDSLVSVENTKLDGMIDHIVVPSTHIVMTLDPRVINQVTTFLKYGAFNHGHNMNLLRTNHYKQDLPDEPTLA